jgi:DNA mismatch repair protein MutS
LFFRLGDFYEAFYEDAFIISKELDLTLTKRQGIPMCGVPYHTSDLYVDKLVAKGFKVAIAEQKEDPKDTKGLLKRAIDRIVSPATVVNSSLIDDKSNNFFVSLDQVGSMYGIALIDLSTSEFQIFEVEKKKELLNELFRLQPKEILISEKFLEDHKIFFEEISHTFAFLLNTKENRFFDHELATNTLVSYLQEKSLPSIILTKGFIPGIKAAGALISHLKNSLFLSLDHMENISTENMTEYMGLDYSCMNHLELFASSSKEGKKQTLLYLLDQTFTPMGGRMLQHWLKHPLLSVEKITQRQDVIERFLQHEEIFPELKTTLQNVRDLERLIMKISSGYASPKDIFALKTSLEQIPIIKDLLKPLKADLLEEDLSLLKEMTSVTELIEKAIVDNPPLRITDGNVFKEGYFPPLDEVKQISQNSKEWIARYQNQLREETGIKTLRVGFTRVFGYYIEVSKGQTEKMPQTFQRRQTLVNGERYINDELKEFEHKILSAEERIKAIEIELYTQLKAEIAKYASDIRKIAKGIARIDVLFSFSQIAQKRAYTRPFIDSSQILHIEEGKHPILEAFLTSGQFISNDTFLDGDQNQLFLITGPNMAGKSTYIRQVALLVIMAQMGSFIPAKRAHIGIIDKVFSRIGASDDLVRGQSTFMVEMAETANILQNATNRSLIILDEIGRGTSTYDGLAIAYAVTEYLLTIQEKKAKTLFATHYWELTELEGKIPGIVNYNVAVQEVENSIVFLHKIVKGGTDKSYGIHVAKLAGIPETVIKRAEKRLKILETINPKRERNCLKNFPEQLSFFSPPSKIESPSLIEKELKNMDINKLTPLEALAKLFDLQKKALNSP